MEGSNLSTEMMRDEGSWESCGELAQIRKSFSTFRLLPSSSKLYPALGSNAGLEGVFDLAHFGDQIGGFD